jgi:tetratricopeptide (TPR) repeat protein
LAGLDELAASFFVQAGDQARDLFAHQEGIHYYQSALALGYEKAWQLHEASGDMHVRLAQYDEALASYETAASLADAGELGRLEHKLAKVYMRQGAWTQADAQLALAEERVTDPDELARLYFDWSSIAFNRQDLARAEGYARQGQTLAATPAVRAHGENVTGLLARHKGSLTLAADHFWRSLELARAYKLPDMEVAAFNNLALTEATAGKTDAAREHFTAALELCRRYGDRHRQAALHNNLADLLHQVGDEEGSMAELKTAVAIYAEIGGRPGNWRPEIWKLTEW